jgi:hypothetical protein
LEQGLQGFFLAQGLQGLSAFLAQGLQGLSAFLAQGLQGFFTAQGLPGFGVVAAVAEPIGRLKTTRSATSASKARKRFIPHIPPCGTFEPYATGFAFPIKAFLDRSDRGNGIRVRFIPPCAEGFFPACSPLVFLLECAAPYLSEVIN